MFYVEVGKLCKNFGIFNFTVKIFEIFDLQYKVNFRTWDDYFF